MITVLISGRFQELLAQSKDSITSDLRYPGFNKDRKLSLTKWLWFSTSQILVGQLVWITLPDPETVETFCWSEKLLNATLIKAFAWLKNCWKKLDTNKILFMDLCHSTGASLVRMICPDLSELILLLAVWRCFRMLYFYWRSFVSTKTFYKFNFSF